MRTHDWHFNSLHMGAEEFTGQSNDRVRDVLLIGDSIVLGGNPLRDSERLGPALAIALKARVWPISAGSWALQNELTWLNENHQVLDRVDDLVILSNSGDFDVPSSWGCSWTHPRTKPTSALWYVLGKYVFKLPCEGTPANLRVILKDPFIMLHEFLTTVPPNVKVTLFLYPNKAEDSTVESLRGVEQYEAKLRAAGIQTIYSIGRDSRWIGKSNLYRDDIHGTPAGNKVLADVMASHL